MLENSICVDDDLLVGEILEQVIDLSKEEQEKVVEARTEDVVVLPDSEMQVLSRVTVKGVTAEIDDSIKPENIKLGATILGVAGNVAPDKPDQSKVVKPSVSKQVVRADTGYELESVEVEGVTSDIDGNIQAENIRYGVEILGVVGSMEQIDLSATTATEEDVVTGKQFYNAQGELVVGGYKDMLQARVDIDNSCSYLFYNYKGTDVNVINKLVTNNVTDMGYMFFSCVNLINANLNFLNTDKVNYFYYMFGSSTKLVSVDISSFNTKNATRFDWMFSSCLKLKNVIGEIDLIKATNVSGIIENCYVIENITFKNIKRSLQLGKTTSWGTMLTNESLINTFKELWDLTGSTSQTLTLSTTSKENIANVYVKLVDVTDEMLASDPYASNKKPCVVCESTDEGAMTLTEFAISKNWAIA